MDSIRLIMTLLPLGATLLRPPVIMKMRTCQKIKHTLCLLRCTVFENHTKKPKKYHFQNEANQWSEICPSLPHIVQLAGLLVANKKQLHFILFKMRPFFGVIVKHCVLLLWFSKMLLNFNRRFVYKVQQQQQLENVISSKLSSFLGSPYYAL